MLFLAFCVCLFCAIGNIVFPIEQKPFGQRCTARGEAHFLFVTDIMNIAFIVV